MSVKTARSKQRVEIGRYLVMDPEIYHGEMTFKGTRVPVDVVLTYVSKGMSMSEVQRNWPDVSPDAVAEALAFAKEALIEKYKTAA
jgi:uncharacterized protein (DUF433 family)